MRKWALAAASICLLADAAPVVLAQELPGQAAQFTPLSIEEPRSWSGGFRDSPSEPRGVRQVSATAPIERAVEKSPLRLAPKREAGRQSLSRPAAASPGKALGTVAGSLGVVLGLFLAIAWSLGRVGPKPGGRLPKEAIEVVGQAPLVGRQQMQLVRVGNRLLLLAIGTGSAETLAEISEPAEVEHLLALCRRGAAGSASATFRQTLEELAAGREEAPRTRGTVAGLRGGR